MKTGLMSVFFCLLLTTIAAGAAAQGDVPDVYVSHIIDGEGTVSEIGVISLSADTSELLFRDYDVAFEDVVVGPGPATDAGSVPPLYVYACAPENGLIIRFDPAWISEGALNLDDVEYVYQAGPGASGNILSPQCGWLTSNGDFIFTDRDALGAWICEGIGFEQTPAASGEPGDPLCQIGGGTPDNLGTLGDSDIYGGGITQAANGDALAINNIPEGQGHIFRFGIDGPTGTFPYAEPDALNLVDEDGEILILDDPLGIARLTTGDVYVSATFDVGEGDGSQQVMGLQRFTPTPDPDGGPKLWVNTCNITLSYCEGYGEAFFFEASADDAIYVGSGPDGCEGATLWKVTGCDAVQVFPNDNEYEWEPYTIVGVGISPTSTPPVSYGSEPDHFINFTDHVYELSLPEGEPCEMYPETLLAQETPKECIDNLIADHVFYDPDGNTVPNDFEAYPVLYLGEKANGMVYNIDGQCTGAQGVIGHAISAYTETVNNPRILRCTFTGDGEGEDSIYEKVCYPTPDYECTVLTLDSFFPGEGVLPDDARIRGTTSASTSDFSQFFLVQAGEGGYDPNNPAEPADFCGFRPPLNTVSAPGPGMSVFREGRSVPFKFKVKAEGGSCKKGPFVAPEGILLSIARIEPDFEQQQIVCVGGDCSEVPYFEPPSKPKKGFHMNVRTDDFEPGIYIATLVATGGEFSETIQTYFEIVP